jgi:hypothetical protein
MKPDPIQAVLPSPAAAEMLLSNGVIGLGELDLHMALHEGYARRWNEGLTSGRSSAGSAHDWNGCQLHNLFWEQFNLGTSPGPPPNLPPRLVREAVSIRGSGWACWSVDGPSAVVHAVANHEYPWDRLSPVLLIDVWEHAYAGRMTDRRGYVEDLLGVVNWGVVARRLDEVSG